MQGEVTLENAYRSHASYVASVARRLLGRDRDVDDVVQDVFIEAQAGLKSLKEPQALKGWLATITVRRCTRKLKLRKFLTTVGLETSSEAPDVPSGQASPEHLMLLGRVYEALALVSAQERVAWTLRYIQGERLEAVSELCGCSLATAKRRIAAAHEVVRSVMGHE